MSTRRPTYTHILLNGSSSFPLWQHRPCPEQKYSEEGKVHFKLYWGGHSADTVKATSDVTEQFQAYNNFNTLLTRNRYFPLC